MPAVVGAGVNAVPLPEVDRAAQPLCASAIAAYTVGMIRFYRHLLPVVILVACGLADAAPPQHTELAGKAVGAAVLADAPPIEHASIKALVEGDAWPRRALGALRLERYGCEESEAMLRELLDDPNWQVRCFAIHSLGRRRLPIDQDWLHAQDNPRVVRSALRYRYPFDAERLERGIEALERSRDLSDRMLAVEIGLASNDEELQEQASELLRTLILRMDRVQAGSVSARMALVTGEHHAHRHYQWRRWLRDQPRRLDIEPTRGVPDLEADPLDLVRISALDYEPFHGLEEYIRRLADRKIDMAVVIDCTGSMFGEIAQVQGGVDGMMAFMKDIVDHLRIAVVAYRDPRDRNVTDHWDFMSDVDQARHALWGLSASGGGDSPEAVDAGLRVAFTDLDWNVDHDMVCVLIGDAPPISGLGGRCVELAIWAGEHGVITHVIQAKGKSVKWFSDIAEAGGGRLVDLDQTKSLLAEVTGLTIGGRFDDEFEEFYHAWMYLCG